MHLIENHIPEYAVKQMAVDIISRESSKEEIKIDKKYLKKVFTRVVEKLIIDHMINNIIFPDNYFFVVHGHALILSWNNRKYLA